MKPLLEVQDLVFYYPGQSAPILNGLELTVHPGEVVGIVGLSGSGKSTLAYCITGIIPHVYPGNLTGRIEIDGHLSAHARLPKIATLVGMVFQNPETQLFFPTVEEELAFGPENLCIERREIDARIAQALERVGMSDYRLHSPHQLSGGQKQLIALASVLTLAPNLLIFDEAMSQIDREGKARIKEVICELRQAGKSIIMIEHDLKNLDIADRILVLQQGRLTEFAGCL